MPTIGYDYFVTPPGQVDEMKCEVCGAKCVLTRNVLGPTSWASAIARRNTLHDQFECPRTNESWHQKALELIEAMESTPSKRLADLMRLDLDDLLRENNV